tara:strand:+ start:21280 stop:21591 length:312 start_codon:yes stop_codon:yes gene_type:complete
MSTFDSFNNVIYGIPRPSQWFLGNSKKECRQSDIFLIHTVLKVDALSFRGPSFQALTERLEGQKKTLASSPSTDISVRLISSAIVFLFLTTEKSEGFLAYCRA